MKFVLNLQCGYYFLDFKHTHFERLQREFPQISFVNLKKSDPRLEPSLEDAEAFATWPFSFQCFHQAIQSAKALRWLQFSSVGISSEVLESARNKNLLVTNAKGIASESIALHALSLILSFERRLFAAFELQKTGLWDHQAFTQGNHGFKGLKDKLVGIVGLGSIGTALAEKAHALKMRVWGIRKDPQHPPPYVEKIFSLPDLPTLLEASDYVILALPLLKETFRLIGKKEMNRMKPTAYLINVARGQLIDEDALLQALHEKRIAGAALDVVAKEPLPAESLLYQAPNLILTPHIAGLDRSYTDRLVDLISENLTRYLLNQPLRNQVDLAQGY